MVSLRRVRRSPSSSSATSTTLPLFIFSRLRTTLNPGINVVSTLLMAITLVLFVFAFVMGIRAERRRSAARRRDSWTRCE